MKVYVLLRDGVPLGYALAAASHCSLWSARWFKSKRPNLHDSERARFSFGSSNSRQRM